MSLDLEVFTKFQMQFMTLTAGSQSRVFKSMPKIFADNVHVCNTVSSLLDELDFSIARLPF